MGIVAAKCPVCGRDIGFEEGEQEYTCIFCGETLMTSALIQERVTGKKTPEAKSSAPTEGKKYAPTERRSYTPTRTTEHHHEHRHESEHGSVTEKLAEPELTEEEVKEELERKAKYKAELHDVVKEVDSLRERREPLKARLKSAKKMTLYGCIFAGVVMVAMVGLYDIDPRANLYVMIGGFALGAAAIFMIIFSRVKIKEIKGSQKKLEKNISDKKDKRDVLIGRLNKINKKLHIHSEN